MLLALCAAPRPKHDNGKVKLDVRDFLVCPLSKTQRSRIFGSAVFVSVIYRVHQIAGKTSTVEATIAV